MFAASKDSVIIKHAPRGTRCSNSLGMMNRLQTCVTSWGFFYAVGDGEGVAMECRRCGEVETETILMTEGKHYAKEVCTECGGWITWVRKPQNEGVRRKTSKYTPEKLNIDCCELCRRPKPMLAKNQTLEVHHKDHDHLHDTPDNLIVLCTFCHKQFHSYALYLNHHFQEVAV